MAKTQASSNSRFPANVEIWNSLKCAIAASSGFQSWLSEHQAQFHGLELDQQVQTYLRETLETLAY